MQRHCLTLSLRPDADLMDEYVERHRHVWPEVLAAMRSAGVLDMQIYKRNDQLFMIMDTTDDFTFDRKSELDRSNPTVMEWERSMTKYQIADPGADAGAKWQRMDCIFSLADQTR